MDGSNAAVKTAKVGLWLALALDVWMLLTTNVPRQWRRKLEKLVKAEGRRLAEAVRNGQYTRADIEEAHREYPEDAEPVIALQWLDRWGVR